MKKICCVNDMPGVGKIALSAMIPILSAKGISVTTLPTALVSNTLDFGLFEILDTTDYMNKTVEIWNRLGFKYDCICTGFMVNPNQIKIVKQLISNQDRKDLIVVVDPIMGDEGKLYNGMNEVNVQIMKELSALADILIPNFTEATYLVDKFKDKTNLYLYYYNEDTEKIEYISKDIKVSNGYIEFEIEHCSKYFVTTSLLDVEDVVTSKSFNYVLLFLIGAAVLFIGKVLIENNEMKEA